MPRRNQEKIDVATKLLPLYNAWHVACEKNYRSRETENAHAALMAAAGNYRHLDVPHKIAASVGRWIARVLRYRWDLKKGVVKWN